MHLQRTRFLLVFLISFFFYIPGSVISSPAKDGFNFFHKNVHQ